MTLHRAKAMLEQSHVVHRRRRIQRSDRRYEQLVELWLRAAAACKREARCRRGRPRAAGACGRCPLNGERAGLKSGREGTRREPAGEDPGCRPNTCSPRRWWRSCSRALFVSAGRSGGIFPWPRSLALVLAGTQLLEHMIRGRLPVLKSPLLLLAFGHLGWQLFSLCRCRRDWRAGSRRPHTRFTVAGRLPDWSGPICRRRRRSSRQRVARRRRSTAPATLRWLVAALICVAIFWSVSHFADRLSRLYLVWGSVVAAFFLNAAFGAGADHGAGRRPARLIPTRPRSGLGACRR